MRRLRALSLSLLVLAGSTPSVSGSPTDAIRAAQWGLDRVEAHAAWGHATGRNVVVAVVDSGVDPHHPALAGKIVAPASCIGARRAADCAHQPSAWRDENGHGTHVAGLIASPRWATTVGVAPDARIMPVRVLDHTNSGSARDVAVGVDYAVARGADVINLSVGGLPVVSQAGATGPLKSDFVRAIERAQAAGVLVVVAADNDGFPACAHKVTTDGAGLCVGATDRRDVKAAYANHGAGLDVVAPGGSGAPLCSEAVLSTYPVNHRGCTGEWGYEGMSGTSMAAPHVAGVGALLAQLGVRGDAAAQRIRATADDLGMLGWDVGYGYGRVNARAAVTSATRGWRPVPGTGS